MTADPRALVAGLRRLGVELAAHHDEGVICACRSDRLEDVDRVALVFAKREVFEILPPCPGQHRPDAR